MNSFDDVEVHPMDWHNKTVVPGRFAQTTVEGECGSESEQCFRLTESTMNDVLVVRQSRFSQMRHKAPVGCVMS